MLRPARRSSIAVVSSLWQPQLQSDRDYSEIAAKVGGVPTLAAVGAAGGSLTGVKDYVEAVAKMMMVEAIVKVEVVVVVACWNGLSRY